MNVESIHPLEVRLTVNGRAIVHKVPPQTTLQSFLHHCAGLTEVKFGCGEGVCGACTVLLDGEPAASCLLLAAQAEGRMVVTVTGLQEPGGVDATKIDMLRRHLVAREAFQCGYCAPGMVVSAAHCIASGSGSDAEAVRQALAGNLCRCSGYEQIVEATAAAAGAHRPEEVPHPRLDLREKMQGIARYPTDRQVDNALVGRVLWSEWPSARIAGIDTSEAESIPGVEAVLTHRDIPGRNLFGVTVFRADQPLLAAERVRSRGDAVALVAARTEEAAREAVRRIRVTYEPLPSVHDVLEALAADAPLVGSKGNLIVHFAKVRGDVEAAFRQADVTVEGTYRCTINDHACMELEGGSGWWSGGTLVLSVPNLTPHTTRAGVAQILGIDEERVRIVTPRMGGSFGKYLMPTVEGFIALLVQKTRRPVRLVLDRQEVLARRTKRHPFLGRYRLGMKRDGAFLALEAEVYADSGPYVSFTPAVVSVFADEAAGAYDIANLKVSARGVLTNNLLPAPMRGFGSQQINFGIESLVEKAARTLGLDPAEIRRKNYLTTRTDGWGRPVVGANLAFAETLDEVLQRLGPRPQASTDWFIGRGVGSIQGKYGYPYGMQDRFVVRLSVDSVGQFLIESDVPDSGTGIADGVVRLVADHLGLGHVPRYMVSQTLLDDPSGVLFSSGRRPSVRQEWSYRALEWVQDIQVRLAVTMGLRLRTSQVAKLTRWLARPINLSAGAVNGLKARLFPFGVDSSVPRTSGSRGMFMLGRAALDAAECFRQSALTLAAQMLKAPSHELEIGPMGVQPGADASRRITWAALATHAGGRFTALGEAHLPSGVLLDPATGNQVGAVDHMQASHGCDVAVHRDTGEVQILRYVACHDVGRALNPTTIRGQILGGIAMGLGQALWEHIDMEHGRVLSAGLHDYLVPTALDVPRDVEVVIVESGGGLGPHGAKGVGEAAAVAAPIAVANALYDAIGTQLPCIPATPEDIVEALLSSGRR